jgi:hypothetical protein
LRSALHLDLFEQPGRKSVSSTRVADFRLTRDFAERYAPPDA